MRTFSRRIKLVSSNNASTKPQTSCKPRKSARHTPETRPNAMSSLENLRTLDPTTRKPGQRRRCSSDIAHAAQHFQGFQLFSSTVRISGSSRSDQDKGVREHAASYFGPLVRPHRRGERTVEGRRVAGRRPLRSGFSRPQREGRPLSGHQTLPDVLPSERTLRLGLQRK